MDLPFAGWLATEHLGAAVLAGREASSCALGAFQYGEPSKDSLSSAR